jgi:hypothetical protein
MQPTGRRYSWTVHKKRKSNQRDCRRKGKTDPGRNAPEEACPSNPYCDAKLAARWAWNHLAKGDQVRIALIIEPFSSDHILLVEVSKVSDRPPE